MLATTKLFSLRRKTYRRDGKTASLRHNLQISEKASAYCTIANSIMRINNSVKSMLEIFEKVFSNKVFLADLERFPIN